MTVNSFSILLYLKDPTLVNGLESFAFCHRLELIKAGDEREALSIIEQNEVDIVIADNKLKEANVVPLLNGGPNEAGRPWFLVADMAFLTKLSQDIANSRFPAVVERQGRKLDITLLLLQLLSLNLENQQAGRKQFVDQLLQREKMVTLGRLMAGVAHELNNPLAFIKSNLKNMGKFTDRLKDLIEFVEQQNLPDHVRNDLSTKMNLSNYSYIKNRISKMIERSSQGAERMDTLIKDLKLFSRQSNDEQERADINQMIESALNILAHSHKNRITINKEYGQLPLVVCAINKLEQVVINLLNNACQAIEDSGEIRITTKSTGEWLEIIIADTGCGLSEEIKTKIFDDFFTTKPANLGTGLGLSISRDIIRQYGGDIYVDSKPGKGAEFTVKLPWQRTKKKD